MGEIPKCSCRAAFLAMCAVSSCPGQLLPSDQSCQTNPQCEINHAPSDIFHSIVKTSNFMCRNLFKGNEWLLKVEGGLWIFQSTSLWLEPPRRLIRPQFSFLDPALDWKIFPCDEVVTRLNITGGKDRWWGGRIFPDKVYKRKVREHWKKGLDSSKELTNFIWNRHKLDFLPLKREWHCSKTIESNFWNWIEPPF